jgi:peptidoglycan/xylan/chitin deacetylase (PgdA/CDA1 family)
MRPALLGNPPRRASRRRPPAPALLKLPAHLPGRVLDVPILMYHHISSAPPATALNYGLTVTDEGFAGQLAYLRDHGYHTVLLRQVFQALYYGKPLPAHPVVLTFDDGYRDNYTDALPLLRRFGDVGEFNIISGYVGITLGVNTYMTWPQIRALVAAGMEIGSHTVDHQDLGTLPEDKIRFELRDSRNVLQRTLHIPVQFLAYPSGEPFRSETLAAQQRMLSLLSQYGYVGALLDPVYPSTVQDAQQPYQLQRVRVSPGESPSTFAAGLES